MSGNRSIAAESKKNANSELTEFGNWRSALARLLADKEIGSLAATFLTTLCVFAIFFGQGVLIARILGPIGRGEFGTAVFFPRDILLYVGLLGGIEIVNRYAARCSFDTWKLKYSAATLGLFSGILTAIVGAVFSVLVLTLVNNGEKAYLIPYCLLICLFVPWEHVHLTVSAVDRGRENYSRYNINRLIYAAAFPTLVVLYVVSGLGAVSGNYLLLAVCGIFVVSKTVGILPTLRGMKIGGWLASFRPDPHSDDGVPSAKILLREGGPYALSMFATELFERLDILLILVLATVEESGFYFVSVPAAALLTIAPNSLAVFTFNAGADGRHISMKSAVAIIGATGVFQLFSMLAMWMIVPVLIVTFYGEPFEPAILFVWYLLPAFAIKGFLQAVDGYLKGRGKPLIGVWARFLSIFAMLGFVFFFYQQYHLLSIPMAACFGQAISMLIVTSFAIREIALPSSEKPRIQ